MKVFTIIGILFLVFGFITLVYGSFPVSAERDSIDLGPVEATIRKEKHVLVPPVLSIAAIGAGITLVVLGSRK